MSYARFSSNAFQSDVYVFRHAQGHYQIHVASNRTLIDQSKVPPRPDEEADDFATQFAERQKRIIDLVEEADRVPICGPMDGASFEEATATDAVERLREIREAGYNVPEQAIEGLIETQE